MTGEWVRNGSKKRSKGGEYEGHGGKFKKGGQEGRPNVSSR